MARIRYLKPEFFDDEDLGRVSFAARLCFAGLWTQADREGRLEDRPPRLKARLFPYDDVDVSALLDDLAAIGVIARYGVNGHNYIQVKGFSKHQRPHCHEPASALPGPELATTANVGASTDIVGMSTSCTENGERRTENGDGQRSDGKPSRVPLGAQQVTGRVSRIMDRRMAPLISRKEHQSHAACGRVCLPASLLDEFIRLRGGPEDAAIGYVKAWFRAHDDRITETQETIGDGPFDFWRNRWREDHGTTRKSKDELERDDWQRRMKAWAEKPAGTATP